MGKPVKDTTTLLALANQPVGPQQAQLAEFECDCRIEEEEGGFGGAHPDGKQQCTQHAVGEAARSTAEKIDGQENAVNGAKSAKQKQQLASDHRACR